MDRAPFFTRKQLGRFFFRALAGAVVCGSAAAAHASGDGLAISGSPPENATVGQAYSFTPTVSDPSRRALSFRIRNRPAWATFETRTGKLSGTPTAANVGWQYNITVTVSDSVATVSLPQFPIRVWPATGGVDKPVISGTPATTVTAGSSYSFQPSARDPAGKALSFSVQHKPAWANFSIVSGALYGTPSSAQTGTYADVVISASNGQYSSALPAFNVTVQSAAPAQGTASLSWVLPTRNTNGTPLTDLAGVRIYYGTNEADLTQSLQVSGTSATTYTLSGLSAGTWYFGAAAYTTTGLQSAMSTIVSKTIR